MLILIWSLLKSETDNEPAKGVKRPAEFPPEDPRLNSIEVGDFDVNLSAAKEANITDQLNGLETSWLGVEGPPRGKI